MFYLLNLKVTGKSLLLELFGILPQRKFNCMLVYYFQRSQHKPAPHSQRPLQDPSGGPLSKKHPGDHVPQRSNELKRPADGVSSSHLGPGGKIARMDRTYSGSSSHSGARHSGSGDGYDPRRSSFSHSERTAGSNKDRSRDG